MTIQQSRQKPVTKLADLKHRYEPRWFTETFEEGCTCYFERRQRTDIPHERNMFWAWDLGWRFTEASISWLIAENQ